jgi:hypothetical protein
MRRYSKNYRDMKIRHEHDDWSRSVNHFFDLLEKYHYAKERSKEYSNWNRLVFMFENSIFNKVDDFPVLRKDLPEELKEKYDNRIDTVI